MISTEVSYNNQFFRLQIPKYSSHFTIPTQIVKLSYNQMTNDDLVLFISRFRCRTFTKIIRIKEMSKEK